MYNNSGGIPADLLQMLMRAQRQHWERVRFLDHSSCTSHSGTPGHHLTTLSPPLLDTFWYTSERKRLQLSTGES